MGYHAKGNGTHEFIDWALAEFRNNRWGAVEPIWLC